jgi:hypothetical protein
MDGTGTVLDQAGPRSFAVPPQTNPVVLTIPGANLYTAVLTDASGNTYAFLPTTFSPTTYDYTGSTPSTISGAYPFTLTLTTVDPNATITSVTVNSGSAISPSSTGVYSGLNLNSLTNTVVVVVTAVDGTTETYTMMFAGGG